MVDANCTAKDRGHRKNSKRGRDCPATVHGGDGSNGSTAPSGTGAAATPSVGGAATTPSGTGAAATPSGTGAATTPSTVGGAVSGLGVGSAAQGVAGSGSSAATSNPSTPTATAPDGDLTAEQMRVVNELGSVLLELALAKPDDRDRTAALILWEKVAAKDQSSKVRRDDLCSLFKEHALCLLFEEIAVELKKLTDVIPGLVGKMLEESSLPPLLKVVAKVLLEKTAAIAIAPLFTPVETLRIKACVLALALCPDPDPKSHRSPEGTLEKNCVIPVGAKVTEPESAR